MSEILFQQDEVEIDKFQEIKLFFQEKEIDIGELSITTK